MSTAGESGAKRKNTRIVRSLLMMALIPLIKFIHNIYDAAVSFIFSIIYNEKNSKPLPPIKNPLLLKSATSLATLIRRKQMSSVVVVKAFIDRINEVNSLINAVVDDRMEQALLDAVQVDEFLKNCTWSERELEIKKPFLGVPFTTKESTECKGMNFTMGMMCRLGVKGNKDADIVAQLKKAGGILLAVTNIPELNLWCETRCMVYGQTNNPYNLTRTVGGSSGGEGAILTACGSPMGIGSDIGGSLRMPAFYCGIFSHKPTTGISPLRGISFRTGLEKESMVCPGPMCKYAEDLIPFLKVLLQEEHLSKLNLDAEINVKNIRVMYALESGDLRASKVTDEMQSFTLAALHHLERISTFPVEKLDLPGFKYSVKLWRYEMSKEPGNFARDVNNRQVRDVLASNQESLITSESKPWDELCRLVTGRSTHTVPVMMRLFDLSVLPQEDPEWAEEEIAKLREGLLEKLGDSGILIFPSHPFPADYHYTSLLRPYNFSYWSIFNVLKLPVTQVPLGLSRDGLPVGVQIVAPPFKDNLCLAVARELEKCAGWVPPCQVDCD